MSRSDLDRVGDRIRAARQSCGWASVHNMTLAIPMGRCSTQRQELAGEQGERVSQLTQFMEAWHRSAGSVARTD